MFYMMLTYVWFEAHREPGMHGCEPGRELPEPSSWDLSASPVVSYLALHHVNAKAIPVLSIHSIMIL